VLPDFEDFDGLLGEATPWRRRYDPDRRMSIEGAASPLRYGDDGLGVVPTGIGNAAATATATGLLASDRVRLDGALVLSVGVAGAERFPATGFEEGFPAAIGNAVAAAAVVDDRLG